MDSKGLDVCNSLEQDKACWRCCCPDGRKKACGHDGLDSLTVGLRDPLSLLQQNRVRKLKQVLQNIWLPRQSLRTDNTPLKPSAYSLV